MLRRGDAGDFLALDRKALLRRLVEGHPVDPRALEDSVYAGRSLGLPGWVDALLWKTFEKAFHRDPDTGALRGWNIRIDQKTGERQRLRNGEPRTFGHYEVVSFDGRSAPLTLCDGLLLDYGRGGNGALDPVRFFRDPIVAVNPGDYDLLLGWTYFQVGPVKLRSPSFFTLVRKGPLDHVARPR